MKIKDMILYLPRGFVSTLAKYYRTDLDDKIKDKILEDGLYHFTDEESAKLIVDSEYLKPATGKMKYTNSYGTPVACMFAGTPDIDNFSKNFTDYNIKNNPYINPCMVQTAVKILPENKEQLKNYKIRNISDSAVLYEGYCILPHERVSIEKMVPDLVRDEQGNPIKNKIGEYEIKFRKAREEELIEGSDLYLAQKDYLNYIKLKAIELGYSKDNDGRLHSTNNKINNIVDQARMESEIAKENLSQNFVGNLKKLYSKFQSMFNRIKTPKLEDSTENIIQNFKFGLKNPYQDKKFGLFVAETQSKQGLEQLSLETVLKELNQSREGEYLYDKYKELETNLKGSKIHGKSHADRVLINSMIIAQKEGILKEDTNDRIKDILITAAAYHDIGRVFDNGPHARRSARKIDKMDLRFSDGTMYSKEDKKLLMAIVESHEGKPEKIHKMVNKYGITNKEDKKIAYDLSTVLRDTDALDRVRLDLATPINTKTNLNPQYLKTDTAKQLLEEAYELENLSKKKSMQSILNYGKENEAEKFAKQYQVSKEELVENQLQQETVELSKKLNPNYKKEKDDYIPE